MRLHALQYLRAVAALAVVYSHSVIQVDAYRPHLAEWGSFGVDIFFIISGFIMVYISKPSDTPKDFFNNRIKRVVPLYWFFTLLMAAILLAAPSVFKTSVFNWQAFATSLFFIPGYSIANSAVIWPIVAPGWSLNYEMYFYLLFAISLSISQAYRILFIATAITVVFTLSHLIDSSSAIGEFYKNGIVFEFVLGMLLAQMWKNGYSIPQWAAALCIVGGFVVIFMQLNLPRFFEFGVPAFFVVTGCTYLKTGANRFFLMLGDSSYALYLSHIFSFGVMRKTLPPMLEDNSHASLLFVLISIVFCVAVSIVVHYAVDNWLLRKERLSMFGFAKPKEI
ncbi:MAG: acyltransferase [Granulosicoccaceae bacterium]